MTGNKICRSSTGHRNAKRFLGQSTSSMMKHHIRTIRGSKYYLFISDKILEFGAVLNEDTEQIHSPLVFTEALMT